MKEIINIQSINQLHELIGYTKPRHPLVSVLDYAKFRPNSTHQNLHFVMNFYVISFKSPAPKSLLYGRQYYDFAEGTLMFVAPNQTISVGEIDNDTLYEGFGLYFHADLINATPLGKKMKDYAFFSYNTNEALHVSEDEKNVLNQIVINIEQELQHPIDTYSNAVIVTYLEQILNYSARFYGRQFIIRRKPNQELLVRFEELLKAYFKEKVAENGLPTVEYFAEKLSISPGYLTELLKHETGKTTKELIQIELLEEAKIRLLNSNKTMNEVAFDLGFEYPQYFNKFFKSKTGLTPLQYRTLN
ncbi:MAG: AraC family transcriptional regulator [Saprospiraceae bacterium]|nr:AraC family transcriptional regulator [Saprospiraceae bacterium]